MLKTKPKPYPYTLLGFDYFPIYYLLIIANPNFALLYIYNKINVNWQIQINVKKLIFKKLVEKYKIIKTINITKYVLKNCRKLKPKPKQYRHLSVFDCLPIYYLLIRAIPDSKFIVYTIVKL